MTTKFLTEQQTVEKILALFEKAQQIKCAVAFWGNGSPQQLGLVDSNKPVKIICNFTSGATNPTAIQQLRANGNITVHNHSRLHAKVYWTEIGAIVGSANASANGLSFEDNELRGWKEASVFVTDESILAEIETWFDDLWTSSSDVSDVQLAAVKKDWSRQRNVRPMITPEEGQDNSLLEALRTSRENFKDRKTIISITKAEASPESRVIFENWREDDVELPSSEISYYESPEPEPADLEIVALRYISRNKFAYEGLWFIPKQTEKSHVVKGKRWFITVCHRMSNICNGLRITSTDKVLLESKGRSLLKAKAGEKYDQCSKDISLYNAWPILFGDARE